MITERGPHVSPFSDIKFIANWHVRDVHFPTITRPHPVAALRRAVRDAHRQKLAVCRPMRSMPGLDPFLPVTNGSYGVPQLRFAQSLYDCGVGAQVSHLTPTTHALAEGSSDTCSPKDNRPDLNLQRVLTI